MTLPPHQFRAARASRSRARVGLVLLLAALGGASTHALPAQAGAPGASAGDTAAPPARQSLGEAWWTGPMLANSASTLPRGHFLAEPYVYEVATRHSDLYGSRAYLLYGVADGFTAGVIPIVGFARLDGGGSSTHVARGDMQALAQLRLAAYHEGSAMPALALMLLETLPTGTYDRLADRPGDGMGAGAWSTTLGINAQTYFWLPTGRILRMRLDLSYAMSNHVAVSDESVYGTPAGFRGHASPGDAFSADAAWEYSLTKRWVLALDASYGTTANTRVVGQVIPGARDKPPVDVRSDSGISVTWAFAPAIEYNMTPNLGVLFGTRVIPASRNTTASVSTVVAINIYR